MCSDTPPEDLANELASHFSSITNEKDPLKTHEIPVSNAGDGLVRLVTEDQIANRLKKIKKPNSRVNGDIPKRLVQSHYKELAIPLTAIFNNSFINRSLPDLWKIETIVPIPKVPTPGTFNELRLISMSTLWSKLLESYVASYTMLETEKYWKKNPAWREKRIRYRSCIDIPMGLSLLNTTF